MYPKKGHFEARQGRPDPRADIFYTRIRGHFGPKFRILDRTFEGIVRGPLNTHRRAKDFADLHGVRNAFRALSPRLRYQRFCEDDVSSDHDTEARTVT